MVADHQGGGHQSGLTAGGPGATYYRVGDARIRVALIFAMRSRRPAGVIDESQCSPVSRLPARMLSDSFDADQLAAGLKCRDAAVGILLRPRLGRCKLRHQWHAFRPRCE